jgi:5-methylcytosine-specific restriction endonuclease McrA
LVACGGRCLCCGASSQDGAVMNVDHIKPRWKFPKLQLTITNLQVLCSRCNVGKGAWDQTDWRTEEQRQQLAQLKPWRARYCDGTHKIPLAIHKRC